MSDKELIDKLSDLVNVTAEDIARAAMRLAELTQPQPIETAPRDGTAVRLFGGRIEDDYSNWSDNEYGITGRYTSSSITSQSWDLCNIIGAVYHPTHWLPCVQVDMAALEGKGDEQ